MIYLTELADIAITLFMGLLAAMVIGIVGFCVFIAGLFLVAFLSWLFTLGASAWFSVTVTLAIVLGLYLLGRLVFYLDEEYGIL